ncbi:Protein of unknown function (DUF1469) [Saccharomonospora marina XMU15]|uniref:Phage holin family protein n=1 Tax=Saccharomonospora marina XMU15 TaxID=882083 RepID=H5X2F8_9PSEU|nr:phage holin family protein [Saccharomonospora marina]EHR49823.1 Protein of unknown function (DUF1469) [Saccharomonospora marina XMU15]
MVYQRHDAMVDERSVAQLVTDLSEQTSRLVRDEMKLAMAELQSKGKHLGVGAGLAGAAGVIAFFGAGTMLAAAVLALALVLPAWAAALVIGGGLLLLAGLIGLIGKGQVRRAGPPVPREAVDSVRKDIDTVRERFRQ